MQLVLFSFVWKQGVAYELEVHLQADTDGRGSGNCAVEEYDDVCHFLNRYDRDFTTISFIILDIIIIINRYLHHKEPCMFDVLCLHGFERFPNSKFSPSHSAWATCI